MTRFLKLQHLHIYQSWAVFLAVGLIVSGCGEDRSISAPVSVVMETDSEEIRAPGLLGDTIDELFGPYDDEGGPGGIVAVLQNNKVTHLKGYGYANREFKAPWTADTLYTFYSTTKPMVAVALLRLEEEGRIDLDAPVRQYLPSFPQYDDDPTVRQMIQHTSGVWQDEALYSLIGVGVSDVEITLDELYEMVTRQPSLSFTPGATQHYNDAAMRIASRVLRRITGKTFDAAMRELVFDPAGMKTAVHRPSGNKFRPNEAHTYILKPNHDTDYTTDALLLPSIPLETAGDGGLLGSIQDFISFARFASAEREGGSYMSRLAKPVRYAPDVVGAYRTSLFVSIHRGLEYHYHSGLFGKSITYVPALDAWVLIMNNAILERSSGGKYGDRKSHTEIIDALLAEDEVFNGLIKRASEDYNPDINTPPLQNFTHEEITALTGLFYEPTDQVVLEIVEKDGNLYHTFMSDRIGRLVRDGDEYTNWEYGHGEPIRLRVTEDGLEAHLADWGGFRMMTRAPSPRTNTAADRAAMTGTYISQTYGSIYYVEDNKGDLVLNVNAGARGGDRYHLTPLTSDVYLAVQQTNSSVFPALRLQISVQRYSDTVTGLTFNATNLRGFELKRVQLTNDVSAE